MPWELRCNSTERHAVLWALKSMNTTYFHRDDCPSEKGLVWRVGGLVSRLTMGISGMTIWLIQIINLHTMSP